MVVSSNVAIHFSVEQGGFKVVQVTYSGYRNNEETILSASNIGFLGLTQSSGFVIFAVDQHKLHFQTQRL